MGSEEDVVGISKPVGEGTAKELVESSCSADVTEDDRVVILFELASLSNLKPFVNLVFKFFKILPGLVGTDSPMRDLLIREGDRARQRMDTVSRVLR